ncbi:hypothetical protein [Acinetobacter haemolyticus]|uniref:hypothetical protein n=1 Tax=Acinetobacter haemolyticus TaxID=29430 RepID=UPI000F74A0EE|nr:hypothetical protein [Acinetobacter haemolyticus]MCU4387335.1 hypothetical protein [Acinetobacter haemolyticus]RSN74760.1 hypothetical protein EA769_11930 [Acinetobacter haemolyticus]
MKELMIRKFYIRDKVFGWHLFFAVFLLQILIISFNLILNHVVPNFVEKPAYPYQEKIRQIYNFHERLEANTFRSFQTIKNYISVNNME